MASAVVRAARASGEKAVLHARVLEWTSYLTDPRYSYRPLDSTRWFLPPSLLPPSPREGPEMGFEKQGNPSDLPGEKIQKFRLIQGHTGNFRIRWNPAADGSILDLSYLRPMG